MPNSAIQETCIFVGCGDMGGAMLAGWIEAGSLDPAKTFVVVRTPKRRAELTDTFKVTCFKSVTDVNVNVDLVILAVTPDVMLPVIKDLSENPSFKDALFVSIAAGLTTATLEEALPQGSRVVRTMPNLPLVVKEGATTLCSSRTSTSQDVALVKTLFEDIGEAWVVDEDQINATSTISGSGPGYVAAIIEALTTAGEEQGLSGDLAYELALQMIYGTASQLKQTNETATKLRESMTKYYGSTAAALEAMYGAGLTSVFSKGVAAAVARSKELAECSQ